MRAAGTLPAERNVAILDARVLAVPPAYVLGQSEVMRRIELALGPRSREIVRLLPMFGNTGIERRYSCVPIEWYEELHDWPERNQRLSRFRARSARGARRAAPSSAPARQPEEIERDRRRLDDRHRDAEPRRAADGTHEPAAQRAAPADLRLGLRGRRDRSRRGPPRSRDRSRDALVLFLVVELCALCFRRDDFSKSNIVATALFGDGAAAALISCEGEGPRIVAGGEYTWPDSLDVMGWDVTSEGLKGDLLTRHSRARNHATPRGRRGVSRPARSDAARYRLASSAIPGGAKVLDALEVAFELDAGGARTTRATCCAITETCRPRP